MEKNINIINSKENIIEMDIEIDGISPISSKCYFVIKTKKVNFSFECKNVSGNKWEATIPQLSQIENTLYDFYIYMVVDGYYFEPYSGTVNIVKSNEIYVKDVSNTTLESTVTNKQSVLDIIEKPKPKSLFSKTESTIVEKPKTESISLKPKAVFSKTESLFKNDKPTPVVVKESNINSKDDIIKNIFNNTKVSEYKPTPKVKDVIKEDVKESNINSKDDVIKNILKVSSPETTHKKIKLGKFIEF